MSCFVMSLQTQLASVMEILVKATISEVTQIVEGSMAGLQAEIDERKKENESLRLRLLVRETEWRTERAYGSIAHAPAGRRTVGVQVQDAEAATGGGTLAREEGFLGEAWSCSLWKPVPPRRSDAAKPESHGSFPPGRAEVECIIIKEESADLEEQANGPGCLSQCQEEGNGFAGKRPVESHTVLDEGGARRGSQPQCCEEGWGSGLGGPQEGLYEPQSELEQEDRALGAGLDFIIASAVGGAWQREPTCSTEQPPPIAPPAKDKGPPGARVGWPAPTGQYAEGAEGGAALWPEQPQGGGGFHGPRPTCPSKPGTTATGFLPPMPGQNGITPGDSANRCAVCARTFSTPWTLRTHERVHTGERPFSCAVCARSFQNGDNLKTHQLVHTGERPFGCPLCGKRFSLLRNLKTHQRTHTGEKPYACAQCGRTFGHLQSLETHQRTHTGEKPFGCTHCGKSFSIAQNLKTHLRIHTGERPYGCAQCGKRFSQRGNLRTHLRTHTGERPYGCAQCGKSFSLLQNLRTHQRIHSSNRT